VQNKDLNYRRPKYFVRTLDSSNIPQMNLWTDWNPGIKIAKAETNIPQRSLRKGWDLDKHRNK